MFKGSKNDIDADAEKLRRANQQKINQLESIFSDKMAREEQLTKLQQQLEVVSNSKIHFCTILLCNID